MTSLTNGSFAHRRPVIRKHPIWIKVRHNNMTHIVRQATGKCRSRSALTLRCRLESLCLTDEDRQRLAMRAFRLGRRDAMPSYGAARR